MYRFTISCVENLQLPITYTLNMSIKRNYDSNQITSITFAGYKCNIPGTGSLLSKHEFIVNQGKTQSTHNQTLFFKWKTQSNIN